MSFVNETITKMGIVESTLVSNSWLSGFIDADGSFSIKGLNLNDPYPRFQFYFCQKTESKSGLSFLPLVTKIGEFLLCNVKERKINGFSQYTVTTSNIKGNTILINYLNDHSLFSAKYLNYMDWKKAMYLNLSNPKDLDNLKKSIRY